MAFDNKRSYNVEICKSKNWGKTIKRKTLQRILKFSGQKSIVTKSQKKPVSQSPYRYSIEEVQSVYVSLK